MSKNIRKLVGSSAAVLATVGLSLGFATSASAGQVVIVDTGYQCAAVWQNDDGSYTDWWNQN